jgi:hypothetical protein
VIAIRAGSFTSNVIGEEMMGFLIGGPDLYIYFCVNLQVGHAFLSSLLPRVVASSYHK